MDYDGNGPWRKTDGRSKSEESNYILSILILCERERGGGGRGKRERESDFLS